MHKTTNWIQHEIINESSTSFETLINAVQHFDISGIEESTSSLLIYYQDESITNNIKTLCSLLSKDCRHSIKIQETKNWNALWESSFDPISVDDLCIIYAHFHKVDVSNFLYAIQITPKMSFGTGHHETTRLMMLQMKNIDLNNKSIFDFGTGTGILAILSAKMGAREIIGIDNMPWAVENAIENANLNGCVQCRFELADHARLPGKSFDVVLVNIIRKVIFDNLEVLADQLIDGGFLLLSGFLRNDAQKMIFEVKQRGFILVDERAENNWVCQLYQKVSYTDEKML